MFLLKTDFSLVFDESHRLSGRFYGSKNDIFGWPMNRRYENCPTLANLNNFDIFCFLNETISIWTSVQWPSLGRRSFIFFPGNELIYPIYQRIASQFVKATGGNSPIYKTTCLLARFQRQATLLIIGHCHHALKYWHRPDANRAWNLSANFIHSFLQIWIQRSKVLKTVF